MKRAACLLLLAWSCAVAAQTVHGRLWRATPRGLYPASALAVTLYAPGRGRSVPAYSTAEGHFYLYNVPPGRYLLEVWSGAKPTSSAVVVGNQAVTELPPLTLR